MISPSRTYGVTVILSWTEREMESNEGVPLERQRLSGNPVAEGLLRGRPCKLQTCADLDLFYLVLVETDQVNLTQPPIPKQLREYGKQNRVPVIIDFIYDSSLSRQIIVDSPNIGGD